MDSHLFEKHPNQQQVIASRVIKKAPTNSTGGACLTTAACLKAAVRSVA
jgi:hypothetical protein